MTSVRKKGMARGIVLVVIGAIMAAFSGWWWYVVGLQAPWLVGLSPFYTIAGVVIVVIGLCLLVSKRSSSGSSSGTTEGTSKRGRPP